MQIFNLYDWKSPKVIVSLVRVFKEIITSCDNKIPPNILDILDLSLAIFQLNPNQNYRLFDVLIISLEFFHTQAHAKLFLEWFHKKINLLVVTVLKILNTSFNDIQEIDPGFIEKFTQVINRSIKVDRVIILNDSQLFE
jgi:hypothetical protein